MNSLYMLEPTKTRYDLLENFPPIADGKKVGVFLSGGMESTLIAKIALYLYGAERVILFYSDEIFTDRDPNGNRNVLTNVSNSAKLLGAEAVYLPFDYDLHTTDKMASAAKMISDGEKNHNVDFTMWGFTKLFYDVAEFKLDPNSTDESIVADCFADPVKYRSVIEEFHLDTGRFTKYIKDLDIPGDVYVMLKADYENGYKIKSPFRTLNKSEVVDLYRQLGCLDLVYSTRSCVTDSISLTGKHCGVCFNCQQRHDAYAALGLPDKTEYASDTVVNARKDLEQVIAKRKGK